MIEQDRPRLIEGGLSVDDRGTVGYVNGFDFAGVRRFYTVTNHRKGFVRAWHAHKYETKHVAVLQGSAMVAAVAIDDWKSPSKQAELHRFVLAAERPAVLYIPAGHANGFMTLTDDARLVFFSSSTLEESLEDDFRYPSRHWDPWQVEER